MKFIIVFVIISIVFFIATKPVIKIAREILVIGDKLNVDKF